MTGQGDRIVSYDGESVTVVVLATNEELIVARETVSVLVGT